MDQALGMIEVVGFACAVNTADVMVKAANVVIVGIERAKGGGWLTIKALGDVGAVTAAVEAGSSSARQGDRLINARVIPRLGSGLADVWLKPGIDASTNAPASPAEQNTISNIPSVSETEATLLSAKPMEAKTAAPLNEEKTGTAEKESYTCNLCKDPACPRKKGDPRKFCIHFDEIKNKE